MRTVAGDSVDLARRGEFDVIVHGCNCFHEMGAGVAKAIRAAFPEAAAADQETPRGDRRAPGTISVGRVARDGLARGNWEVVARIIAEELRGLDHPLVEYPE